jgi:hypothetical protein
LAKISVITKSSLFRFWKNELRQGSRLFSKLLSFTQRIGIGDRMTSSRFNVAVTSQFGLQSEVFLMKRSVRHFQGRPPHCTISCFDCIHSTMFPDSRRYGYFQKWSRPVYHHPLTHSLIHPFNNSPVHPFTRSHVHPFTRSPVHPFTTSPLHYFTPSPLHPITPSPLHPITPSPLHPSLFHLFPPSPLHHFNSSPLSHFATLLLHLFFLPPFPTSFLHNFTPSPPHPFSSPPFHPFTPSPLHSFFVRNYTQIRVFKHC